MRLAVCALGACCAAALKYDVEPFNFREFVASATFDGFDAAAGASMQARVRRAVSNRPSHAS